MATQQKKVVVIGGSGFLGSHIADCLTSSKYKVVVFDLQASLWLKSGQTMVTGNILDYDEVSRVVKGAHAVYHLAGIADIGQAVADPRATIESNIMGSVNVIEACIRHKVKRLLVASTIYVYSDKGSFYRASKQAVESLVETYSEKSGLKYTILRYGSLYGPRAQSWNGLKRYVLQAIQEGKIRYPGNGKERREYIHVVDAANLSVQALAPEYGSECLTITGSQVMSSRELLGMIQEISTRKVKIEFVEKGTDFNLFHYSQTPYRYTPRRGKKLVPTSFVDLGQGILEIMEEIDSKGDSPV